MCSDVKTGLFPQPAAGWQNRFFTGNWKITQHGLVLYWHTQQEIWS